MSRKFKQREQVYAILRYDGFHEPETPVEVTVTVKEIVRSLEMAKAEVLRLNALETSKDVHYWWQMTRLFPDGRAAGQG
jgi:hypothetical protein